MADQDSSGRVRPPQLSQEALAARVPRPPEELVGALQDRVHRDTGVARPARSVKAGSVAHVKEPPEPADS